MYRPCQVSVFYWSWFNGFICPCFCKTLCTDQITLSKCKQIDYRLMKCTIGNTMINKTSSWALCVHVWVHASSATAVKKMQCSRVRFLHNTMEAATKDKILSLKPHTHLNIKIERGGGDIYSSVCKQNCFISLIVYSTVSRTFMPWYMRHDQMRLNVAWRLNEKHFTLCVGKMNARNWFTSYISVERNERNQWRLQRRQLIVINPHPPPAMKQA